MRNIGKKTREQLLKEIEDLECENNKLKNDLDYFIEQSNKLYEELEEYKKQEKEKEKEKENVIKDINNFIWKLKINGLLDNNLEDFINEYLKYYN